MGPRLALTAAMAAAMVGLSAPGNAQDVAVPCRLCDGASAPQDDKPKQPIRLDIETTLDFDQLIVAAVGGGKAMIRPDGSSFVSGTVGAVGSRAMVGRVVITGDAGRYVRVDLPGSVTLYGSSGGVLRLDSITTDLPALARIDPNGRLEFRFGGELTVEGGLDGDFRGDVPIDVEYF